MASPDLAPPARAARPGRTGVALGALIGPSALGVTAAAVALPDAAHALGQTPVSLTWALTVYTVCLALASAIGGRLLGRAGARSLLRAGAVVLVVGTAATAAAPSLAALTVARGIVGVGAGLLAAVALGLAGSAAPDVRPAVVAGLAGVMAASVGSGPLLGGLLAGVSWRAVLTLPVLAVLAVPMAPRRAGAAEPTAGRLDVRGMALLVVTAGAVVLAVQAPATGMPALGVALVAGLGAAGAVALAAHVARVPHGFLPREIAGRRELVPWWLFGLGAQAGQVGALVLVPQLLRGEAWPAPAVGATLAVLSVAGVAASRAASRVAARPSGVAMGTAGVALLAIMLAAIPVTGAAVVALLAAAALGFAAFSIVQVVAVQRVCDMVAPSLVGAATGLLSLVFLLGAALGSALSGLAGASVGLARAGAVAAALPALAALGGLVLLRRERTAHPSTVSPIYLPSDPEETTMQDSKRNVAVVYYSATGSVYRLAEAVARGATKTGADVRLLRIAELAPREAIDSNPAWAAHLAETADVPEATLADLEWADAVVIGTPTRFGLPASQVKQFIDRSGPLWGEGKLAGKVYASFTSTSTRHGGQESTLLALNNTFYHWGGFIVPPGYTDPIQFVTGNPYGAGHVAANGALPGDDEITAAEYLGFRVATVAQALARPAAAA